MKIQPIEQLIITEDDFGLFSQFDINNFIISFAEQNGGIDLVVYEFLSAMMEAQQTLNARKVFSLVEKWAIFAMKSGNHLEDSSSVELAPCHPSVYSFHHSMVLSSRRKPGSQAAMRPFSAKDPG